MMLVNFVLVMLWQRDALRQEMEKNRIILTGIQALLPANCSNLKKSLPAGLVSVRWVPNPSLGHIQIYYIKRGLLSLPDDVFGRALNSVVRQAGTTGHYVSRHTGSFFSFADHPKRLIAAAEPIIRHGKTVGGVGIVRSLDPMFQKMWQAEKTTLAYILINLLILGVIAFFRMGKLIARPIDRLVGLADQYGDREEALFALDNDNPGNEFGRLAHSLNSMLARIEDDRKKMVQSVVKLEEVNKKLVATRQDVIRAEKLASVGRLAAGLAHEIGNPIGVVQGYLGLLKQKNLTPSEYEDFVCRSESELQRINKLVRQLLDFSRSSSGRRKNVFIHAVLYDLVEMMQSQPCMREIEIGVNYAAGRDGVRADPDQIRQVFFNCLLNAVDSMASGDNPGKVITITTQIVEIEINTVMQSTIEVRLADTGTGIAKDDLDNIFDPFFTTKEPGKGTGLGLSVAYSIIEGCGGSMRIESKVGKGTTVFVALPLG
jgi:signal transduction histidine kinase